MVEARFMLLSLKELTNLFKTKSKETIILAHIKPHKIYSKSKSGKSAASLFALS